MAADDPRERLRRYLEQRRELGESELVLDSMDVGEVLRLLGARGDAAVPAGSSPAAAPPLPESRDRSRVSVPGDERASAAAAGGGDWRATLRASGAGPEAAPKPRVAAAETARPDPRPSAPPPVAPEVPFVPAAEPMQRLPSEFPRGIVIGGRGEAVIPPAIATLGSLDAIAEATRNCMLCPLYSTATTAVPGEGNPAADFMVVGEAPGATEDETGRPFVGQAGQLLTRILGAINLRREDVFIANVLKHRPPGNRNPKPDEVAACSPYLLRQIALVRPRVILALGTFATQTLLDTKLAIGKLRGQVHEYHGVPLIVTYHPAALLRNPAWKRPTWDDVQLARRILDSATGA